MIEHNFAFIELLFEILGRRSLILRERSSNVHARRQLFGSSAIRSTTFPRV
jgi:hypothetical protein